MNTTLVDPVFKAVDGFLEASLEHSVNPATDDYFDVDFDWERDFAPEARATIAEELRQLVAGEDVDVLLERSGQGWRQLGQSFFLSRKKDSSVGFQASWPVDGDRLDDKAKAFPALVIREDELQGTLNLFHEDALP